MATYSHLLGRKVTVEYRAGDILLPASGTFSADSGRSVFLEQHLVQKGKTSYLRWEIPYQCILRIEEVPEPEAATEAESAPAPAVMEARSAAAGANPTNEARSGSPTFLPFTHRPETA